MSTREDVNSEAMRPKSNFKGSPYKQWQCGDSYQYPVTGEGDHWEKLLNPLLEKDRIQCESWKDEVQNLLIFAGLFSAVLTAFVVLSYPSLQPDQNEIVINLLVRIATRLDDPLNTTSSFIQNSLNPALLASPPQPSSIRINIFWFVSLVLSLSTALVGIVSLQWLREHQQYPGSLSPSEKFALFNMRAEGLEAWYVPQIFSSLPLLLQLALTFFFVGLIDFLLAASVIVAIPVIIFIGAAFAFLILTTTIPSLQMLVFCLPLANRTHRVPQQAPYQSPQSRLFRRLATFSKRVFTLCVHVNHAVYRLFLLFYRKYPDVGQRFTSAYELESVTNNMFYTLRSSSWLSFDTAWVAFRDAYAKSIFDKEWWMTRRNREYSGKLAPFYDLTRGLATYYFEPMGSDPTLICSGYLSVQEMTSRVMGDKASNTFAGDSTAYNRYLQCLLLSDPICLSSPSPTFSSLLTGATVDFMQDENKFLFLSRHLDPPPSILQHFAELHIRIANFLYPRRAYRTVRDSLGVFPSYPNLLLAICYTKSQSQIEKYGACFEGAISEQFSAFVYNYLESVTDTTLEDETLLTSLYGHTLGDLFKYAAIQQPSEKIPSTLDIISTNIKNSLQGTLNKRSDLLFYISAYYANALWFSELRISGLKDGYVPVVAPLLPLLRQYLDARGTLDAELRRRLGIPDISRFWWSFLKHGTGLPSTPEEGSQDYDPLPCIAIPEISINEYSPYDASKMDPQFGDLV